MVQSVIMERRLAVWQAIKRYATNPLWGTSGSIEQLCQQTGVSARTLNSVCHTFSGLPVKAYIVEQRLQLALDMLHRAQPGQTTVTEIATFCGFQHLGRFSGIFRSYHGQLPSLILRRVRARASGRPNQTL